jgi:RHS repeat-associated protein
LVVKQQRPVVLSERGPQRVLHATYILSNFGPGIRTDRNGSVLTLSDDTRIEPLMDAGFNNAAMAKPSGGQVAVGYEQTDAFGNLINPSGALADVGSFSWRGREGTINFRFVSTSGDPGLYRMGDRAMEASTGRFTQADRLVLDGMHPLASNRYVYAIDDPINYTDPTGYDWNYQSVALTGLFIANLIGGIVAPATGLINQATNGVDDNNWDIAQNVAWLVGGVGGAIFLPYAPNKSIWNTLCKLFLT